MSEKNMAACILRYKIFATNEEDGTKKISKLLPSLWFDLAGKPIKTSFGYFFISQLIYSPSKLLEYSQEVMNKDDFDSMKQEHEAFCQRLNEGNFGSADSHILEEKISSETLKTLVLNHPDVVNSGFAHLLLFTVDLTDFVELGGCCPEEFKESLQKLSKIMNDLAKWNNEMGDIKWEWVEKQTEKRYKFSNAQTNGFTIDVRFFDIKMDETLEQLERRIDQTIKPIKKYLFFDSRLIT